MHATCSTQRHPKSKIHAKYIRNPRYFLHLLGLTGKLLDVSVSESADCLAALKAMGSRIDKKSPDRLDSEGRSPLHWAAYKGHCDAVATAACHGCILHAQ